MVIHSCNKKKFFLGGMFLVLSSFQAYYLNCNVQTGEQVKNMAQGAAEAVKNTLGMSQPDSDPNTADHPTSTPTTTVTTSTATQHKSAS